MKLSDSGGIIIRYLIKGADHIFNDTELTDMGFTDAELMGRMRRCGHILHHRYPTGMSQNRILLILKNEGAMKQRELMERMRIQAGSLSEIISKVEGAGYIERVRCEDDKRSFELRLTDYGRERAEVFERERAEMARELYSDLNCEEKTVLFELLGRLLTKWSDGCECRAGHQTEEKPNA